MLNVSDSTEGNQDGTEKTTSPEDQMICKEHHTKAEHTHMRQVASRVHQQQGRVGSIFVKTMDKGSPQLNHGPGTNRSPVTKDPELVVLCSMLDEAHTNAIMRLRLQEKLEETGKRETALSKALKKYYGKLMQSEYKLTIMHYNQTSTKTIMANLVKDRKKIIDFIGGEEVAVRLVQQRQNKHKERKEQLERYIKTLHKTPKAVYFQDDEIDEITKDKIMEELTLEIKTDIEQYVNKKYQMEIYGKLLSSIKATQLVEELECHLLLEPSVDVEEWLEGKWKELAELKGTSKATDTMEIVYQTIVKENIILKSLSK